jgi:hypothetical protein
MSLNIPKGNVNVLPHLNWSIQISCYKDANANEHQKKDAMLKQYEYGWRQKQSCCVETPGTLLQHNTHTV